MRLEWNQMWGIGVIVVGIIWIVRRNVPVGFESRPPLLYIKGKWAVLFGVVAIIIGLYVGLEIPKQIKIDRCLDSGGSYDYETDKCIKVSTAIDNQENLKKQQPLTCWNKTTDHLYVSFVNLEIKPAFASQFMRRW